MERVPIRPWRLLPCLLALAGCQTAPTVLPSAEPPPASECRWEASGIDTAEIVRDSVTALEADDYTIRHTEQALGLVSAERSRRIADYGDRYNRWAEPTWFGAFGVGRGGGLSSAIGFGFGGFGPSPWRRDATRLERVSLVANDGWVRVTRDMQVIDWRGERHESRSASDAEFCRKLRNAMATVEGGEVLR